MGVRHHSLLTWGVAGGSAATAGSDKVAPVSIALSHVRGVLFDLPGVLYDATRWRRWLWQLAARMGVTTEIDAFYQPWDARYAPDVHCGRRQLCEAWEGFLLSAGLTRGQVDEVQAASEARRREWETEARPLPGVREAVVRLRAAGISLGVLANSASSAEELRQRLSQFVPADAVAAVISSRDLECAKPDARCYRAGLAALGLSGREVAFVSSVPQELAAAKALGLATVALNQPDCAAADLYLESFAEFPDPLAPRCGQAAAVAWVA